MDLHGISSIAEAVELNGSLKGHAKYLEVSKFSVDHIRIVR